MKYCLMLLLVVVIGLTSGCSPTPVIRPADLQMLANSNLGFLHIGKTTRDIILLKMGLPAAHFESDRIWIYQVLPEKDGEFQILAPQTLGTQFWDNELRKWRKGTYSLVLVFSKHGALAKMGLVGSE